MSDKVRLTGLWKNESKDGGTYLSGSMSPSSQLLILENKYKDGDNDPDYIAFMTPNKRDKKEKDKDKGGL